LIPNGKAARDEQAEPVNPTPSLFGGDPAPLIAMKMAPPSHDPVSGFGLKLDRCGLTVITIY
jgi:hypothetical protein